MQSSRQHGKAEFSTLLFFGVLALGGWIAWKVGPVYIDHWGFRDRVEEICRTPKYKVKSSDTINEMLIQAVRKYEMTEWIGKENFQVTTTDTRRRIELSYEREVDILPGWKHTFKMELVSEQPLL